MNNLERARKAIEEANKEIDGFAKEVNKLNSVKNILCYKLSENSQTSVEMSEESQVNLQNVINDSFKIIQTFAKNGINENNININENQSNEFLAYHTNCINEITNTKNNITKLQTIVENFQQITSTDDGEDDEDADDSYVFNNSDDEMNSIVKRRQSYIPRISLVKKNSQG